MSSNTSGSKNPFQNDSVRFPYNVIVLLLRRMVEMEMMWLLLLLLLDLDYLDYLD